MTMIQIQDALIARLLKAKLQMNKTNAQKIARHQLEAKGYTDAEARQIVRDAVQMADLERGCA